ncbi:hypothetical protein EW146_g2655 [Bondarzewia mesenterica]|uniref:Dynamin N-terminal domain-containing protein n=1 Tax=Bondarzewia mesenterica TaxID=1095465 RepID=A0A4S4M068_9AGAM|nr:hypothetical protein EW146_g2655 [Bondarzewia mesenterica]
MIDDIWSESESKSLLDRLEDSLKSLTIRNATAKNDWIDDIKGLQEQDYPQTIVAVYGVTGAGKSSLLNAILDDPILPTSGMRACTAVAIAVSYHEYQRIEGDVGFISRDGWLDELAILRADLADDESKAKQPDTEIGARWSKVHAVYPSISPSQFVLMSGDEVFALDGGIADVLGTTQRVVASDARNFQKDIAKFISTSRARDAKRKPISALWPLVQKVDIRCNAAALSTGAVFVDLPGVADSNAARNRVAEDYLKASSLVWIVSPITRAVSDKIARGDFLASERFLLMNFPACLELLGKSFRIQLSHKLMHFYLSATKCDDVICHEVISGLGLHENAEYQSLQSILKECVATKQTWRSRLDEAKINIAEKKAKLRSLDQTDHAAGSLQDPLSLPAKRRFEELTAEGEQASDKRQRQHYSAKQGDVDLVATDCHQVSANASEKSGPESKPILQTANERSQSAKSKQAIHLCQSEINELDISCDTSIAMLREVDMKLSKAKQALTAFCALARSEVRQRPLPSLNFPSQINVLITIRSPVGDAVLENPPVFMCSAREYHRLNGEGDDGNQVVCFSNIEDTGIPALQEWCHTLTKPVRTRAATRYASSLDGLADIRQYLECDNEDTDYGRAALRSRWSSTTCNQDDVTGSTRKNPTDVRAIRDRLQQDFDLIVKDFILNLKDKFETGLHQRCAAGADMVSLSTHLLFYQSDLSLDFPQASGALESTLDDFVDVHWATFRADQLFGRKGDLFGSSLKESILNTVSKLLDDIVTDATPNLRSRVGRQVKLCAKTASNVLARTAWAAESKMRKRQRSISHSLVPHVRDCLTDGYTDALLIKGRGTTVEQKECFREFVLSQHKKIFKDAVEEVIMQGLNNAADRIKTMLDACMKTLALKVEVEMAVLWEGVNNDPAQLHARSEVMETAKAILNKVEMWTKGGEGREPIVMPLLVHDVDTPAEHGTSL